MVEVMASLSYLYRVPAAVPVRQVPLLKGMLPNPCAMG